MLLVCVNKNGGLFKRRVAHEHCAIEDWIRAYAEIWIGDKAIIHIDDYCNGVIYAESDPKTPIITFETYTIGML